jgi:hypothetical protein
MWSHEELVLNKVLTKILRVSDNQLVDAVVFSPFDQKHIADWETFWRPRLQGSKEEDSHWDWLRKVQYASAPNFTTFALESEAIAQGLMIVETDLHRSFLEAGKSLVYIDYLATAPWNRSSLQKTPMFKAIGSILFSLAVCLSDDLGFKGRIGLHALPNAELFYRNKRMRDCGLDAQYYNLRYFELEKVVAQQIISGII